MTYHTFVESKPSYSAKVQPSNRSGTWSFTLFGWLSATRLIVLGASLGAFPMKFESIGIWIGCQLLSAFVLSIEYAAIYSRELPQFIVATATAHTMAVREFVQDFCIRSN
eukprot:SAG31_NODE_4412_length_3253_cov_1.928028_3_plen_110_part_00